MEGILGAAAVLRRICERTDQLDLLEDGARPPVRDDERQRRGVARADVDEVDVEAVDIRRELRQGIELCFRLAPVVATAPVLNQLLHLRQLRPLRPIGDRFLVRPPGGAQALAKIIERRARDVDAKWTNPSVFRRR